MKNRKTTFTGIATIVLGIGNAAAQYANGGNVDVGALIGAIFAGVGLILARDAKGAVPANTGSEPAK